MTDAAGHFRATGIAAGLWHVSVQVDAASGMLKQLTYVAIPSDGAEHEFLYARPHLLVRAAGVVAPPVLPWRRAASKSEWPETPRLVVRRVNSRSDDPLTARDLKPKQVEPGLFICDVEQGHNYIVAVIGGEVTPTIRRVSVAIGSGRIEVALPAGEPVELATMTLEPRDEQPVEQFSNISYSLRDAATGLELLSSEAEWSPTQSDLWARVPFVARVPPGSYDLQIEGRPWWDAGGSRESSRAVGSWEERIVLVAGQALRLEPMLPPGARVRLTLTGNATLADTEQVVDGSLVGGEIAPPQSTLARTAASVILRTPSGLELPVLFKVRETPMNFGAGFTLRPLVQLYHERLSECTSPGPCRLVASLAGGRTVEKSIILHPGETLAVELQFPRAIPTARVAGSTAR